MTTTIAQHLLVVSLENVAALRALRWLPTWLRREFEFDPEMDRQVWRLSRTGLEFWNLSGVVGQLENLARGTGACEEADDLLALRIVLNTAASDAIKNA